MDNLSVNMNTRGSLGGPIVNIEVLESLITTISSGFIITGYWVKLHSGRLSACCVHHPNSQSAEYISILFINLFFLVSISYDQNSTCLFSLPFRQHT